MLGGRMSNQEEDEVEDELDALEAEVSGIQLPDAPSSLPDKLQDKRMETPKERARRRAEEQASREEAQPVLA
jgi:charged multivesicular body protein 6